MAYMTRMVIDAPSRPLRLTTTQIPEPAGTDVLIKVAACGVCRTDLHVADGEITARYPVVPGHEIVGRVIAIGPDATHLDIGDRVGVPWLGRTCGVCPYCRSEHENLCDQPTFTGATRDGGYASHVLADSRFCLPIPPGYDDAEAAPLLCAGLIGYRSLVMAGQGRAIGLYGFGAAAHIIAQVALWQGRSLYAFTRPGDRQAQDFALKLGCRWAGGSDEPAPEPLDAAIIFAAEGALVPIALKAIRKGGRVVCAGIHMSDIPSFPYADLWGERSILSVANLTREDGLVFLDIAPKVPVRTSVTRFKLEEANEALSAVREGRLEGAAVLIP
ncbi:zinc-dependent alcohol dehydrogenase family protein [Sphingomonas sp.]|uniref:zinc-dependent alcohol dehydrogenase family protein n=1 Tax=Sphingomonas sp. TaxID=28214 RepID=UPI0025F6B124|nr:zinc-dependent alcohol dehydrogenase family protein [Sphingomonas sp.]